MKCIIIEDQAPARRIIQKYVTDLGNLELIGSFSTAIEGVEFLKNESVDLIFLPMELHFPLRLWQERWHVSWKQIQRKL